MNPDDRAELESILTVMSLNLNTTTECQFPFLYLSDNGTEVRDRRDESMPVAFTECLTLDEVVAGIARVLGIKTPQRVQFNGRSCWSL